MLERSGCLEDYKIPTRSDGQSLVLNYCNFCCMHTGSCYYKQIIYSNSSLLLTTRLIRFNLKFNDLA